ncbi:hypothetical protein OEZ85_002774 [Tetradesmus obliquus]|uniref:Uncharacterized protein n=1 Tax=Tetradesmus obliquus TaxID=3088 RepID=A0ABY8U2R4_TETOB|nr:hypothetical protein OEZ85_002774 [Tetradesmus obliquus]
MLAGSNPSPLLLLLPTTSSTPATPFPKVPPAPAICIGGITCCLALLAPLLAKASAHLDAPVSYHIGMLSGNILAGRNWDIVCSPSAFCAALLTSMATTLHHSHREADGIGVGAAKSVALMGHDVERGDVTHWLWRCRH